MTCVSQRRFSEAKCGKVKERWKPNL
uniref:Uncharacterized protein n=1 Tax=Rhizophora mucronata TaxID=61149 RepID=A0A2P2P9R6_RHIMU